MDTKERILGSLKEGRSLFLVGFGDSGKTWFAINELVPFLQKKGLDVTYFSDCDHLLGSATVGNAVVVDEVEVLQDRAYLESTHPDERPYYSDDYVVKVKSWFDKLRNVQQPCVYIVTRNSTEDVKNFMEMIKKTDWDSRTIETVEFHRG